MIEEKIENTIDAYDKILSRLDQIEKKVRNPDTPFNKEWIDTQEVCQMLNISKRSAQNYRDSGRIPFSNIDGKMYYKYQDIVSILESNYTPIKSSRNTTSRRNGIR
jgi:hypothetical protein